MNVDRESTGFKLFKQIFHCRVKAKHLIDVEHAAEFGLPSTGDDQYDAELAEVWNDVYLPASDIAELINDGADVIIVALEDATRIYELIQNHLEWWEDQFRQSFYFEPGRIKRVKRDIELLSRVAAGLFPMVESYVRKEDKHLTARDDSIMPFRPEGETYTLDQTDLGRYDPSIVKEHRTLEDIIDTKVLDRVRIWER